MYMNEESQKINQDTSEEWGGGCLVIENIRNYYNILVVKTGLNWRRNKYTYSCNH